MITHTLALDHCWVCGTKFTDHGGPPNFFKHTHHIVPRAYGGADGPTVDLCDSHHSALHKIALKLMGGKPYHNMLTKDNGANERLLWLASVVVNARANVERDPNKPIPVLIVVKGETKDKLLQLKAALPRSSYASILERGLHALHAKYF